MHSLEVEAVWAAYNEAVEKTESQYPHCDSRILHAPGQCKYCDKKKTWQRWRQELNMNFTGESNRFKIPCPADADRPAGSESDHRKWGGNRPTISYDDPSWPEETFASQVLYGDPKKRKWWKKNV